MRWTEHIAHVVIIARPMVAIFNNKANRCAGSASLEQSREHLYSVVFAATGGYCRLSWTTAVKVVLDGIKVNLDTCGHSIDNAS